MNHHFGKRLGAGLLVLAVAIGVFTPRRASAMEEEAVQAQAGATEATQPKKEPSFQLQVI